MIFTSDFGGSLIKMALIENGKVIARRVIKSYAYQPFSEWAGAFKQDLQSLCGEAGVVAAALEGMVWALPLIIAPNLRHATCSFGKYEDTTGKDFCKRVEETFALPLLLDNDARAALIGEWQAGAGRGKDNLAMVTLGTGIGTAVVMDGKPLRGRSGMAGNLGGLSITHLNSGCDGGLSDGCSEAHIATWALQAKASARPGFADSLLARETAIDYRRIFELAGKGDGLATDLRNRAIEGWSAIALNLIQAYDPECVVFGGGIMAGGDVILPAIKENVNKYAVQAGGEVDILAAELGDEAAFAGCEWLWNTRNNNAV